MWNILDFAKTCNFYSSADQHSRCPSYNTVSLYLFLLEIYRLTPTRSSVWYIQWFIVVGCTQSMIDSYFNTTKIDWSTLSTKSYELLDLIFSAKINKTYTIDVQSNLGDAFTCLYHLATITNHNHCAFSLILTCWRLARSIFGLGSMGIAC